MNLTDDHPGFRAWVTAHDLISSGWAFMIATPARVSARLGNGWQ
jgi:hypothetical protein